MPIKNKLTSIKIKITTKNNESKVDAKKIEDTLKESLPNIIKGTLAMHGGLYYPKAIEGETDVKLPELEFEYSSLSTNSDITLSNNITKQIKAWLGKLSNTKGLWTLGDSDKNTLKNNMENIVSGITNDITKIIKKANVAAQKTEEKISSLNVLNKKADFEKLAADKFNKLSREEKIIEVLKTVLNTSEFKSSDDSKSSLCKEIGKIINSKENDTNKIKQINKALSNITNESLGTVDSNLYNALNNLKNAARVSDKISAYENLINTLNNTTFKIKDTEHKLLSDEDAKKYTSEVLIVEDLESGDSTLNVSSTTTSEQKKEAQEAQELKNIIDDAQNKINNAKNIFKSHISMTTTMDEMKNTDIKALIEKIDKSHEELDNKLKQTINKAEETINSTGPGKDKIRSVLDDLEKSIKDYDTEYNVMKRTADEEIEKIRQTQAEINKQKLFTERETKKATELEAERKKQEEEEAKKTAEEKKLEDQKKEQIIEKTQAALTQLGDSDYIAKVTSLSNDPTKESIIKQLQKNRENYKGIITKALESAKSILNTSNNIDEAKKIIDAGIKDANTQLQLDAKSEAKNRRQRIIDKTLDTVSSIIDSIYTAEQIQSLIPTDLSREQMAQIQGPLLETNKALSEKLADSIKKADTSISNIDINNTPTDKIINTTQTILNDLEQSKKQYKDNLLEAINKAGDYINKTKAREDEAKSISDTIESEFENNSSVKDLLKEKKPDSNTYKDKLKAKSSDRARYDAFITSKGSLVTKFEQGCRDKKDTPVSDIKNNVIDIEIKNIQNADANILDDKKLNEIQEAINKKLETLKKDISKELNDDPIAVKAATSKLDQLVAINQDALLTSQLIPKYMDVQSLFKKEYSSKIKDVSEIRAGSIAAGKLAIAIEEAKSKITKDYSDQNIKAILSETVTQTIKGFNLDTSKRNQESIKKATDTEAKTFITNNANTLTDISKQVLTKLNEAKNTLEINSIISELETKSKEYVEDTAKKTSDLVNMKIAEENTRITTELKNISTEITAATNSMSKDQKVTAGKITNYTTIRATLSDLLQNLTALEQDDFQYKNSATIKDQVNKINDAIKNIDTLINENKEIFNREQKIESAKKNLNTKIVTLKASLDKDYKADLTDAKEAVNIDALSKLQTFGFINAEVEDIKLKMNILDRLKDPNSTGNLDLMIKSIENDITELTRNSTKFYSDRKANLTKMKTDIDIEISDLSNKVKKSVETKIMASYGNNTPESQAALTASSQYLDQQIDAMKTHCFNNINTDKTKFEKSFIKKTLESYTPLDNKSLESKFTTAAILTATIAAAKEEIITKYDPKNLTGEIQKAAELKESKRDATSTPSELDTKINSLIANSKQALQAILNNVATTLDSQKSPSDVNTKKAEIISSLDKIQGEAIEKAKLLAAIAAAKKMANDDYSDQKLKPELKEEFGEIISAKIIDSDLDPNKNNHQMILNIANNEVNKLINTNLETLSKKRNQLLNDMDNIFDPQELITLREKFAEEAIELINTAKPAIESFVDLEIQRETKRIHEGLQKIQTDFTNAKNAMSYDQKNIPDAIKQYSDYEKALTNLSQQLDTLDKEGIQSNNNSKYNSLKLGILNELKVITTNLNNNKTLLAEIDTAKKAIIIDFNITDKTKKVFDSIIEDIKKAWKDAPLTKYQTEATNKTNDLANQLTNEFKSNMEKFIEEQTKLLESSSTIDVNAINTTVRNNITKHMNEQIKNIEDKIVESINNYKNIEIQLNSISEGVDKVKIQLEKDTHDNLLKDDFIKNDFDGNKPQGGNIYKAAKNAADTYIKSLKYDDPYDNFSVNNDMNGQIERSNLDLFNKYSNDASKATLLGKQAAYKTALDIEIKELYGDGKNPNYFSNNLRTTFSLELPTEDDKKMFGLDEHYNLIFNIKKLSSNPTKLNKVEDKIKEAQALIHKRLDAINLNEKLKEVEHKLITSGFSPIVSEKDEKHSPDTLLNSPPTDGNLGELIETLDKAIFKINQTRNAAKIFLDELLNNKEFKNTIKSSDFDNPKKFIETISKLDAETAKAELLTQQNTLISDQIKNLEESGEYILLLPQNKRSNYNTELQKLDPNITTLKTLKNAIDNELKSQENARSKVNAINNDSKLIDTLTAKLFGIPTKNEEIAKLKQNSETTKKYLANILDCLDALTPLLAETEASIEHVIHTKVKLKLKADLETLQKQKNLLISAEEAFSKLGTTPTPEYIKKKDDQLTSEIKAIADTNLSNLDFVGKIKKLNELKDETIKPEYKHANKTLIDKKIDDIRTNELSTLSKNLEKYKQQLTDLTKEAKHTPKPEEPVANSDKLKQYSQLQKNITTLEKDIANLKDHFEKAKVTPPEKLPELQSETIKLKRSELLAQAKETYQWDWSVVKKPDDIKNQNVDRIFYLVRELYARTKDLAFLDSAFLTPKNMPELGSLQNQATAYRKQLDDMLAKSTDIKLKAFYQEMINILEARILASIDLAMKIQKERNADIDFRMKESLYVTYAKHDITRCVYDSEKSVEDNIEAIKKDALKDKLADPEAKASSTTGSSLVASTSSDEAKFEIKSAAGRLSHFVTSTHAVYCPLTIDKDSKKPSSGFLSYIDKSNGTHSVKHMPDSKNDAAIKLALAIQNSKYRTNFTFSDGTIPEPGSTAPLPEPLIKLCREYVNSYGPVTPEQLRIFLEEKSKHPESGMQISGKLTKYSWIAEDIVKSYATVGTNIFKNKHGDDVSLPETEYFEAAIRMLSNIYRPGKPITLNGGGSDPRLLEAMMLICAAKNITCLNYSGISFTPSADQIKYTDYLLRPVSTMEKQKLSIEEDSITIHNVEKFNHNKIPNKNAYFDEDYPAGLLKARRLLDEGLKDLPHHPFQTAKSEYVFEEVPDATKTADKPGTIYLDDKGNYAVQGLEGKTQTGKLEGIPITNLKVQIEDELFKKSVLDFTSKAGHASKEVTHDELAKLTETRTKGLRSGG